MAEREFKPDKLILHCADTPDEGDRYGFQQVNEWHRQNGWKDPATGISCGYHWVVRRSGIVEPGRPESSRGAHVLGWNDTSLAVCYMGTRRMTEFQVESWLKLCHSVMARHSIPIDNVMGHYELNGSKPCPGQDMVVHRELLRQSMDAYANRYRYF